MTRSQVRYLLGTPMVTDSFNKEQWDYIYYLRKGRSGHLDTRRVTVYFEGDKVAKLDKPSDAVAAKQEASAAEIKNGRTYYRSNDRGAPGCAEPPSDPPRGADRFRHDRRP